MIRLNAEMCNCRYTIELASVLMLLISMKECTEKTVAGFIEVADNDGINSINQNIDLLIDCSIKCEHYDITAFLLDYKYKNNLHTEKNWEL